MIIRYMTLIKLLKKTDFSNIDDSLLLKSLDISTFNQYKTIYLQLFAFKAPSISQEFTT